MGTAGLPAAYGGFETLAQNLVAHLGDRYDFTVFCKRTPRHKRLANFLNARLVYLPLHSNGWESLPYDIVSLLYAFATSDMILYLGPVAGMILPINRIFKKNLIVNFGGLMSGTGKSCMRWKRGICLPVAGFALDSPPQP